MNRLWTIVALLVVFVAGFLARDVVPAARAQAGPQVFELRTYTAPDGKLGNLHARFRDHTLRIFEKHGIRNVVYFAPTDAPLSENTLIYFISHASREAATTSWEAFRSDPEWQKVSADSQVDGRIVSNVESVFLVPTDYSPMK